MNGEQIRAKRKELGLTQKQLANIILVTTKTVNRWENGKTTCHKSFAKQIEMLRKEDVKELL